MKYTAKQSGFTTIEILVTLFVAAIFLIAGYQLYGVIIKNGGQVNMQARAVNTTYDYLQRYKPFATNPCTAQTPLTNSPIPVTNLSNVTITVAISCPYGTTSSISKVLVTLNYSNPQQVVSEGTFVMQSATAPLTLITIAGTGGTVSSGGTYTSGSTPTITATPNSGYLFSSWSGSTGCSGAVSHNITMDGNKSCTANFTVDWTNWYSGVAGTALDGKHVYKTDLGTTYTYETSYTSVTSPQGATGLDPSYPSYMSLVNPQTNPGVDFSAYPAQNACKAIGGRLPNMQELLAVYAGKASYGNNFQASVYWSSTEWYSTESFGVDFGSGGAISGGKTYSGYVRCVSG
jgi:Tfp pilus assembly protein PilV